MKKVILIDGNNLMFRSFYAMLTEGNIMRNSKNFPTNALFGFANMINKIIGEEKPEYVAVAFDVGKNFRKQEYEFYKEGREETPFELKKQMPIAKKMLEGMGIKYLELEPYEADDIIGTLVKMIEDNPDFDATIVSSDKDLLQLINFETDVKLLKKESFIRYDEKKFKEDYGFEPIKIIDLKSLMGDASDNIPGVKGIGEKTALKLLQEYQSLENVYANIDNIKDSLKEKLINDKENAFISKRLATIYKEVPLNIDFEELKYLGENEKLLEIYTELEFYSLLRKTDIFTSKKIKIIEVSSLDEIKLNDEVALYIEIDNENYHYAKPLGMGLTDGEKTYYVPAHLFADCLKILNAKKIITYDIKKHLNFLNINYEDDLMIGYFLLNKIVKDDISHIMIDNIGITFSNLKKNKFLLEDIKKSCGAKVEFIFENKSLMLANLKNADLLNLYEHIELPLVNVLFVMENFGVKCEKSVLKELKSIIEVQIATVREEIYQLAGLEFNISSPKQLGEILFDKLNLSGGKKNKIGYKTDVSVLEKLRNTHPIIDKVLLYRHLTKINSTYIDGLEVYINKDGIIKPIFKQTLARTGRLSCTEPNLQNIPIKESLGRQIRKAFVPQFDLLLSVDYSQIELRILAHISGDDKLIAAFNNGEDIHTRVAADIFEIEESKVTKLQRSTAKAVIFGIVYGISGFGLGENLNIAKKEADKFIKKYYELYPKVKLYMDEIINNTKITGEVKTLFGRIRKIDEIKSNNFIVRQMGARMALNTPIQGSNADIIKVAMINIAKEFKEHNLKSKLILQVHDELIFDIVKEEESIVRKIVQNKMENVIKLSVPLKVTIGVAKNWYEV